MRLISYYFLLLFIFLISLLVISKQLFFLHSHQNDFMMDFFNTFFHVQNNNYYSSWRSVYTPFNFLILEIFQIVQLNNIDATEFRNKYFQFVLYFYVFFIFLNFYYFIKISNSLKSNKNYLFIIFCLSLPTLYLIERGNLLFLAIPLVFLLFKKKNINLLLATLISLKLYFILIIFFIFKTKEFKLTDTLFYIVFLNILSLLFLSDNFNMIEYLSSLTNFSSFQKNSLSGVLSLNYSAFVMGLVKSSELNSKLYYDFISTFGNFSYFIEFYNTLFFKLIFLSSIIFLSRNFIFSHSLCISYLAIQIIFTEAGGYIGILNLPILLYLLEYKEDIKIRSEKKVITIVIVLILLAIVPTDYIITEYSSRLDISFFFNETVQTKNIIGIFQILRSFLLILSMIILLVKFSYESSFISWGTRNQNK